MTDHPITPPTELVQQLYGLPQIRAIEKAFEAGANEELEACIAWFDKHIPGYELVADRLRAGRRPKPPSLAEQGLAALRSTPCTEQCHYDALFAALNRLAELEDSND